MKRIEDRIIVLKFLVKQDKYYVISAYAPHVGLALTLSARVGSPITKYSKKIAA